MVAKNWPVFHHVVALCLDYAGRPRLVLSCPAKLAALLGKRETRVVAHEPLGFGCVRLEAEGRDVSRN